MNYNTDALLPSSILKKFDHVGIAVRSVDEALAFYRDILGGRVTCYKLMGTNEEYTYTQIELGEQRVEFVEPYGTRETFLTKFLTKHGEGMHHLTFQVRNLEAATSYLRTRGIRIVDGGADDPSWKTAFVSPKSSRGVLIQIYETTEGSPYDHQ